MLCTDQSEDSNCHKIGSGHGVPSTILEMPQGQAYGLARYAVVKSMIPAEDQHLELPGHLHELVKRESILGRKSVIYDLTFDYEWRRILSDLGDSQVRVNYSNENGYWDAVVDEAAERRKKRPMTDVDGNH